MHYFVMNIKHPVIIPVAPLVETFLTFVYIFNFTWIAIILRYTYTYTLTGDKQLLGTVHLVRYDTIDSLTKV